MSQIGVLTIGKETGDSEARKLLFEKSIEKVDIVNKDQLKDIDGLIIEVSQDTDILEAAEWLLMDDEQKGLIVWIICQDCPLQIRQLYRNVRKNLIVEIVDNFRETDELPLMIRNAMNYRKSEGLQKIIINENKCSLDVNRMSLQTEFGDISLTRKEMILFRQLNNHKNDVVLFESLYESLWGENQTGEVRCKLANLICSLRKKLNRQKIYKIVIIRNTGYMLAELSA